MLSLLPRTSTVCAWFQFCMVNVSVVEAPYVPLPLFTSHSVLSAVGRVTPIVTFAVGRRFSATVKLSSPPRLRDHGRAPALDDPQQRHFVVEVDSPYRIG